MVYGRAGHEKPFLSTPSARRATEARAEHRKAQEFLSTPSARRATRRLRSPWHSQRHFYPRPPRGGRPEAGPFRRKRYGISIHALREEGDVKPGDTLWSISKFLSTPSARRATRECEVMEVLTDISIHALREEGDLEPEEVQQDD